MDLLRLKQAYQEELVKVSVHPLKAEQTAEILSVEELKFIGDIWPEWGNIFTQIQQETNPLDQALQDEIDDSVDSSIKRFIDLSGGKH